MADAGSVPKDVILQHTSYFVIEMTTETLQAMNINQKDATKWCIPVGIDSQHGLEVLCVELSWLKNNGGNKLNPLHFGACY